ncbi:MAG: class I SAM-dependent methyltransferase [Burkholderiales bacterium]|nr:class I SAM-dependent methyltransferase [Burkholderiales bacterium]
MSWFYSFISRQLAKPTGLFGRFITARWLENANREMNRVTLASLDLTASDRLLEVGFGSGYLLAQVLRQRQCARVAGVDLSQDMVDKVKRRLRKHVERGEAVIELGDIARLPFPDRHFTRLCSVNTIYFWRDAAAALRECRRVLQPGGKIALCFDAKESIQAWPGHTYGFALYEVPEVERMLIEAGFSGIEVVERRQGESGRFYCLTGDAA